MRHADEMYDLEARNAVTEVEVTWGITQSTSAFGFKKTIIRMARLVHSCA